MIWSRSGFSIKSSHAKTYPECCFRDRGAPPYFHPVYGLCTLKIKTGTWLGPRRGQGDYDKCKPGGASCTWCLAAQHPPVEQGHWESHHCCTDLPLPRSAGKMEQQHVGHSPEGLTLGKLSSRSQGEALGIHPWDSSQLQLAPDGRQCQLLCPAQDRCPLFNQITNEPVT